MRGRFGAVTLHDELRAILEANGNAWMTTSQLAAEVNRRGLYRKKDGSPVEAFQVHGRTRNYGRIFERDGSRVRLVVAAAETALTSPTVPASVSTGSPQLARSSQRSGISHALLASVLEALGPDHASPAGAATSVPARPGLYAIHAESVVWIELGLGEPPDGRPLYVGKSESSLLDRDLLTHFADGRTGSSTLRRSVAALLHEALGLRGTPRNPANPGYFSNYGLSPADDRRLSVWMLQHLRIATWESPATVTLGVVESEVLRQMAPPLNLQGVTTPWSSLVSSRRAVMAQEARDWGPGR